MLGKLVWVFQDFVEGVFINREFGVSLLFNTMPKPAIPWFKRFCELYARHDRSVYRWSVNPHPAGVLITLTLDRGNVYLLAHSKNSSASYATTQSLALSIHQPPDSPNMPGNGELVIRQFISILDRADKGDIHLP